ncbi:MAG TPA: MlaE family lipid ABC transporter permease subunit [Gammaproteobacteria bacterium]|nr:MlaE family lipid ABC transporter permease subunit [Gammaproteobacteria bacterium]
MKENNKKAKVDLVSKADHSLLTCTGEWSLHSITDAAKKLKTAIRQVPDQSRIILDISSVSELDSAGTILLLQFINAAERSMNEIDIVGANKKHQIMFKMYKDQIHDKPTKKRIDNILTRLLIKTGKTTLSSLNEVILFVAFLGESVTALLFYIRHPSSIRFGAIAKNIEEAGIRALPIVALTSFLIGVVIAYQSAVQLEKFGANIFIVDMIGISVTRELAPLITAIVVAGRSGSSYTAQIGVMKLTEEIDAMKTMGFNPFRFLVLPRMIALMIAMPLMIFLADIMGIAGGMLISKLQLNLSFSEFIQRLQNVVDTKHLWVGLIKGPVFAWLIATVGCFRGFQVSYNTESIGRYTTISVVNAIFLVIASDAIFSIIFTELGI